MPIVTSALTVPESSPFAILKDLDLCGSYRSVASEQEMLGINPSFCKEGMLIRCLDTGKTYTLASLISSFDDFGDPVAETKWTELTLTAANTSNQTRSLARWSLEVETEMEAGIEVSFTFNLAKAIIVQDITVSALCRIEFSESINDLILDDFSSFNYKIVHEFTDLTKLRYGVRAVLPDGTELNTRYLNICINKDPITDVNFYYRVKNTGKSSQNIKSSFNFISLHTS